MAGVERGAMSRNSEQREVAQLKASSSGQDASPTTSASSAEQSGALTRMIGPCSLLENANSAGQDSFAKECPLFEVALGDNLEASEGDDVLAKRLLEFRRSWEVLSCSPVHSHVWESLGSTPVISVRRTNSDGKEAKGPEAPYWKGGYSRSIALETATSPFRNSDGHLTVVRKGNNETELQFDCSTGRVQTRHQVLPMSRDYSCTSEQVTPGGSIHGGSLERLDDYSMFRTGSRRMEGAPYAPSSGQGNRNTAGGSPVPKPEVVTDVSAKRFFDSLQGPELELAKDPDDLLLPSDHLWPFLLRFPISSFGITLGLGSQTILWKELAASRSMHFLHIPSGINLGLWCLALLALITITTMCISKGAHYFEAVRREFYHPVRVNYFFAPWIACMFLAVGVPPAVATRIHPAVWCVFMAPLFVLELKIYGEWLSGGERKLSQVANPTTHLAVVGNFVGAILAATVGWKEPAIFFWAVGLALYLVVFVTLCQSLPTTRALPKDLHPVYFMFVAAPSSASVAWMNISGDFDYCARIVYFVALFLFTSLIVRLNFFRGLRFSIAWWAYTFPMTGAAVATVHYSNVVTHPITQGMVVLLTGISSTTVLVVFVLTCFHALTGTLLPNDMAIAVTYRKCKPSRLSKSRDY